MSIIALNKENFSTTINNHDLVVIDFWAEWCAPCRSFAPIFEQVAEKNPDAAFCKINTEEEQELAQEFMIRSIPTVAIFRQKIMIFCEAGLLPGPALEDLIQQAKALDMNEVHKNLGK